jgi:hypothetical protein
LPRCSNSDTSTARRAWRLPVPILRKTKNRKWLNFNHFFIGIAWVRSKHTSYVLSAEEQFLSTQCCCHSVLWLIGSCRIIIIFIINNFISLLFLLQERVSWTFFRLSLCQFSD